VSQAEKLCQRNIAKLGKIPDNSCILCRKINKLGCRIKIMQLNLHAEDEGRNQKDFKPCHPDNY
jgi:hypothetical protein